MEGRAQANTPHRLLLPGLQGSGKNKSSYFIATPRNECHKSLSLKFNFILDLALQIYTGHPWERCICNYNLKAIHSQGIGKEDNFYKSSLS